MSSSSAKNTKLQDNVSNLGGVLAAVEATSGPEMMRKIQQCRILLVGAGGIGCELLKNLALTGFTRVDVIDLDTIDVSNLNRQLLFRSQHVGSPKCTVACQVAAEQLTPYAPGHVQYIAHHGNVCDPALFHVQFVEQFDLVLNALDNVTARRRVNRLCLVAKVPLIEAGTTGYLGQVNVIDENVACYECQTQEPPKVYPICTIRSTPSMPVHTIVWAKELYKLLFAPNIQESMLYEDTEQGEEPSTYMQAVLDYRKILLAEESDQPDRTKSLLRAAAVQILTNLYRDEIQKQLDMDRYKTAQKKPLPLSPPSSLLEMNGHDHSSTSTSSSSKDHLVPPTRRPDYKSTQVWSMPECMMEFVDCLTTRALAERASLLPAFDKDDELGMILVTAASQLRSHVFGIEPIQSFYSAKGIAGNIIPAIATTNAICAGLQILQAFHILRAQLQQGTKWGHARAVCSYMNCLRNKTRNGLYVTAVPLEDQNPRCFVCRQATLPLTLQLRNWTLKDLLDKVIKKALGFEQPILMLEGDLIWEEGDDADSEAFETNLGKLLPDLPCGGIKHGTMLTIEDFSQNLTIQVAVANQEVWEASGDPAETDEDRRFKFVLQGAPPKASESENDAAAKAPPAAVLPAAHPEADGADDDDVVMLVSRTHAVKDERKRPAKPTEEEVPPVKKAKVSDENGHDEKNQDDGVIELD